MMSEKCPLCESETSSSITNKHVKDRVYWHCPTCDLIFLPKAQHADLEKEKARYQTHQNNPMDQGYREFLLKFTTPVLNFLDSKKMKVDAVLDYGAGPGSPLAGIFAEEKIKVYEYDPYFKPFGHLLQQKYDLVVSTEVIEHFREPMVELKKLAALVREGGLLAIMTQFHQGAGHFGSWWYAKDFTHVSFYSEKTLRFWAEKQKFKIELMQNPVAIFSLA